MENIKNKLETKNLKEEERHTFFDERNQDEGTKKHGIKEDASSGVTGKSGEPEEANRDKVKNSSLQSDNDPHGSNAEFADPNETNKDYLKQPQPMSPDLENVYAGAASTKEERDALVQKRKKEQENDVSERKDLGQAGNSSGRSSQMSDQNEDKDQFVDTERGNYSKHNDYQDRQGYEKNKNLEDEFPNGERNRYSHIKHGLKDSTDKPTGGKDEVTDKRSSYGDSKDTPDFPSSMENKWDDTSANPKGYGETDFDDEEIRRRQDEGNEPWDESTGDNIDDKEQ